MIRQTARVVYLGVVLAAGFAAIIASTPSPQGQTDNGLPPAIIPTDLYVAAPFVDGSGNRTWTGVNPFPGQANDYRVLPLSIEPKLQVTFLAPYPSKFHMNTTIFVAIPNPPPNGGGGMVQKVDLPEYLGNQQGPATGYFQLVDVNQQSNPSHWTFIIRLPDAFLTSTAITIGISNVSENPVYTGFQAESAQFQFGLDDGGTDVSVLVSILGDPGQNMVTSDPPGISCRPNCNFRFIGWSSVKLTPTKRDDYGFSGWSGDCTGFDDCTLTMNGTKKSVTAWFGSSLGPPCNPANADCPGGDPIPPPTP